MLAVYEVCTCDGDDIVDRVLIDVSGDPDDSAICSQAVKAAGYNPDARCTCGANSAYYAHFAGYANHTDETVVVPIALIKEFETIVAIYQVGVRDYPKSRDCLMNAVVSVVGKITDLPTYPVQEG